MPEDQKGWKEIVPRTGGGHALADGIQVIDIEVVRNTLLITFSDGRIAMVPWSELYNLALEPDAFDLVRVFGPGEPLLSN